MNWPIAPRAALVALLMGVLPSAELACTSTGTKRGDSPSDAGGDAKSARDAGQDARAAQSTQPAFLFDAGPADETMPPTASEELTARVKHLIEAIAQDNPDLSIDILFPRDGYVAARDMRDATKAWEKQVKGPYFKALHRLRRKHKDMARAAFISFELGHSIAQVTPRKRAWKKPLWTVHHSKLTYSVDGKTHRLDIAEMVGWRGSWYVTRIRG